MKNQDTQKYLVIVVLAMLAVGAGMYFVLGGGSASIGDKQPSIIGPWSDKLVNYNIITSDRYTGAEVAATAKVYDKQPDEWLNARGDFNKAAEFTTYTAASGIISVDKETPGRYYVVLTAAGYNTDFFTINIPDGTGRGDLADYQAYPDTVSMKMTQKGTTTAEHLSFTLTNATAATLRATALQTVASDTEFRGWKVIVNDELGFSTDTDGNGKYDEGISRMTVTIGSKTVKVFDPSNGVDLFDSNDEYSFLLDDIVADENDLVVRVEIRADTADYIGANDEKWGAGEGVLSYIKIYDASGSIFANVQVVS